MTPVRNLNPAASRRPPTRRVLVILLTAAIAAGVVWGVYRLGVEARQRIGPRDRYSIRFADIVCEPPRGIDRSTFLYEVRYAADVPVTFQIHDPELGPKLTAAFERHPWVARVVDVAVDDHRSVIVKLTYRTPSLAVRVKGDGVRVVDAAGVVLPHAAEPAGLAELVGEVAPPVAPAGKVWANATVRRAVELVDAHHPQKLEFTAAGWRLTMPDQKVLLVEK